MARKKKGRVGKRKGMANQAFEKGAAAALFLRTKFLRRDNRWAALSFATEFRKNIARERPFTHSLRRGAPAQNLH